MTLFCSFQNWPIFIKILIPVIVNMRYEKGKKRKKSISCYITGEKINSILNTEIK